MWRNWSRCALLVGVSNTVAKCVVVLQQIKQKYHVLCLVAQSCLTLWDPMDCSPPGSSAHGDSLGKSSGVGSLSLLQGIFPTQGSNPGLLHWREDSLPPRKLPNCLYFHVKIFLLFGAQANTTVVVLFSHSQNTLSLMASKQASTLAIMAIFPFFLFFFLTSNSNSLFVLIR